jgi:hypothetical protein
VNRAASAQEHCDAENQGERPVLHLLLPIVSVEKRRRLLLEKLGPHALRLEMRAHCNQANQNEIRDQKSFCGMEIVNQAAALCELSIHY